MAEWGRTLEEIGNISSNGTFFVTVGLNETRCLTGRISRGS